MNMFTVIGYTTAIVAVTLLLIYLGSRWVLGRYARLMRKRICQSKELVDGLDRLRGSQQVNELTQMVKQAVEAALEIASNLQELKPMFNFQRESEGLLEASRDLTDSYLALIDRSEVQANVDSKLSDTEFLLRSTRTH